MPQHQPYYQPPSLYQRQPEPSRKKRWPVVVAVLVVLAVIAKYQVPPLIAKASDSIKLAIAKSKAPKIDEPKLTSNLDAVMADYKDVSVSLVWENVITKQVYSYGTSKPFAAASTSKLLTAADVLHQVELGKMSLDDEAGDYTNAWQLQQMVQQSNNDAWVTLNHKLGGNQLESYAHNLGLSSYDYQTNQLTAADEASLLQQLEGGQLLNSANTRLLKSYMQNTNDDTLIPPAVPSGANVYHKYGELDDNVHDAAIVEYQGHKFVLVIYTTTTGDTPDYDGRTSMIHKLTSAVMGATFK